jgi:hypothetical protein
MEVDTMKCPICSADVMDGFSFCPKCGSEMSSAVPAEPAREYAETNGAASSGQETMPFEETRDATDLSSMNTPDFVYPASPTVPAEPETLTPPAAEPAVRPGSVYLRDEQKTSAAAVPAGVWTAPAPAAPVSAAPAAVEAAPAPSVPSQPVPVPAAPAAAQAPVRTITPEARTAVYPETSPKAAVKGETNPILSKEFKPLSTAGVFWYFILTCIPVVGFICLLSFAFGGKNRSKKSLSRAILIGWLIFVILVCISFVVGFIFFQDKLVNLFNADNWISLGNSFGSTFFNL